MQATILLYFIAARQEHAIAAPYRRGDRFDGKVQCPSESLQLESGDTFVLYTDGITEAINSKREDFGRERLADVIEQNQALSAEGLIQKILQTLNGFTGGSPLADDITLVVYKVK